MILPQLCRVQHEKGGISVADDELRRILGGELPPPSLPTPRPWKIAADLPPAPAFDAIAVIATLRDAGLRGLGGAGFPTAQKWELVRNAPGDHKYAICNAD